MQCWSASIVYYSRAFLFFPSFPFPSSSLPFSQIFPPSFSSCPLLFLLSLSFYPSFFSYPSIPSNLSISPISSFIVLPFRALLSLLASFPYNSFFSYSSINLTPFFSHSFILSYPSISSYLSLPLYPSCLFYPTFPSYPFSSPSVLPIPSFLVCHSSFLRLFLPFSHSSTSFKQLLSFLSLHTLYPPILPPSGC